MRYYISDLHLFHHSLNDKMDMRGFENVDEMHKYIVSRWNKKVNRRDEVVILGDFSMGNGKETNSVMDKLNGKLFLIKGNHDRRYLKDKDFHIERFEWIEDYKELKDNHRKIVMCHYPVFCYNGQYRLNRKEEPLSYMLYGHVHNTYDEILVNRFIMETRDEERMLIGGEEMRGIPCNMINCFCMFSDYQPLSLDEWIELDKRRRENMI